MDVTMTVPGHPPVKTTTEAIQRAADAAEKRSSSRSDNTGTPGQAGTVGFAKGQLKSIVERIERLDEERKTISDDIRDVYAEAKGNGFDVKALRTIVRMRKQDEGERAEQETILETYMQALGML